MNLYYLDDFGLTYSQLLKLGSRKISVTIDLYYPKYEQFFPFAPEVRKSKINEILQREYDRLIRLLPTTKFKRIGTKLSPRRINVELKASEVKLFKNKKFISDIWFEKIEGYKKKKRKSERLWYAVKAIFPIQIEGATDGMQDYEERIIIVKANSFDDAKVIAFKEFKEYSDNPYLNPANYMVRWHFEKIVDVFEISLMEMDKFGPKGTEVYSILKKRKLRPEYEWHPIKKYRRK